jgi:hypothetical protein
MIGSSLRVSVVEASRTYGWWNADTAGDRLEA